MSPIAGDMLAISSEQRMHLGEIQKDIDAHLDKLLSVEQKKQFAEQNAGAGGFGSSSQPGQVMTGPEQNRLKLTEDQKKDVIALQKAVDGRFENVLTEAQKKQLKSVFAPFGPLQANPGGGLPAGKILSAGQQDTLKLSVEQRKRMAEIQKEVDAKLETLLTEDQRKQLATMRLEPAGVKTVVQAGAGPGPAVGSPLFRAYRYGIDYPAFAGKILTPGKPLEDLQPKEPEKKSSESKK